MQRESGLPAIGLLLLDIDTQNVVRDFPGHSAALTVIAFSADSRWLVSSQIPFAVKSDLCTD